MLVSDVFSYVLLTITIAASYSRAESSSQEYELSDEQEGKQIVKRDAPLIIDHFPFRPILKHRPKFIYKRVSNSKYRSPKPAYGVTRTKQRSAKPSRKVMRKYRKSVNPKYSPPSHYKRPPKIRYANPRAQDFKPLYGLLKRSPDFQFTPKPTGFGEPPTDYYTDNKNKNYADQSDAYRGQLKTVPKSQKSTRQKLSDPIDLDEIEYLDQKIKNQESVYLNDFDGNFAAPEKRLPPKLRSPEYNNNKNAKRNYGNGPDFRRGQLKTVQKVPKQNRQKLSDPIDQDDDYLDQKSKTLDSIYLNDFDENFGSTEKRQPSKVRSPDYETPAVADNDENTFSDVYNSEKTLKMDVFNKRKKQRRAEKLKTRNKPLKSKFNIRHQAEDDVIVGGRYAEPPGRFFANHRGSMSDGDNLAPPSAVDSDVASSATISPYVNYKHSNLAFSPQNLNDAFSIVD